MDVQELASSGVAVKIKKNQWACKNAGNWLKSHFHCVHYKILNGV